jgi:hypothetical protein
VPVLEPALPPVPLLEPELPPAPLPELPPEPAEPATHSMHGYSVLPSGVAFVHVLSVHVPDVW